MARLDHHRTSGYCIDFFIPLPIGDRYLRSVYRHDKRDAEDLAELASHLEALSANRP